MLHGPASGWQDPAHAPCSPQADKPAGVGDAADHADDAWRSWRRWCACAWRSSPLGVTSRDASWPGRCGRCQHEWRSWASVAAIATIMLSLLHFNSPWERAGAPALLRSGLHSDSGTSEPDGFDRDGHRAHAFTHHEPSQRIWERFAVDAGAPHRCGVSLEVLRSACSAPGNSSQRGVWARKEDVVYVRGRSAGVLDVVLETRDTDGQACVGDLYVAQLMMDSNDTGLLTHPNLRYSLWANSVDMCNGTYGFTFRYVVHPITTRDGAVSGTWKLRIQPRTTAFRDYWVHTGPFACGVIAGNVVMPLTETQAVWPPKAGNRPMYMQVELEQAPRRMPSTLGNPAWVPTPVADADEFIAQRCAAGQVQKEAGWLPVFDGDSSNRAQTNTRAIRPRGDFVAVLGPDIMRGVVIHGPNCHASADRSSSGLPPVDTHATQTPAASNHTQRASSEAHDAAPGVPHRECDASEHQLLAASAGIWWSSRACEEHATGWPCRTGVPPASYPRDLVSWVPLAVLGDAVQCSFRHYAARDVAMHLKSLQATRILFIGDSLSRNLVWEFAALLGNIEANYQPNSSYAYNPRGVGSSIMVDGIAVYVDFLQTWGLASVPSHTERCGKNGSLESKAQFRRQRNFDYMTVFEAITNGKVAVPDILVLGNTAAHDVNIEMPWPMHSGIAEMEQLYLTLRTRGFRGPVIFRESSASTNDAPVGERFFGVHYNSDTDIIANRHGWRLLRTYDLSVLRPDRFYDNHHIFPAGFYKLQPRDFPRTVSHAIGQRLVHLLMSLQPSDFTTE